VNIRVQTPLKQVLATKLADSLKGRFPESTPRDVFGAVVLPGKATAVVGMRRSGKTTYVHQLRRARMDQGSPREFLPYINFEDERLADIEASDLGFLLEEHSRRFPGAEESGTVTWSFDEIQVVPGWERFIRRLLDIGGQEVFLTGSSAALLSRELATSLRGRAWEVLAHAALG